MLRDRFSRHRLNKKEIKTALKAAVALLQPLETVSFAYLHGSAVDFLSGESSVPPHDIDLAVFVSQGDFFEVETDLQLEFSRLTGLSPEVLDLHTLNTAPDSVAMEIIKSGRLLFCRDAFQHACFLERVSNACRRQAGLMEAARG